MPSSLRYMQVINAVLDANFNQKSDETKKTKLNNPNNDQTK
ncbi:hypothetical protein ['Camptotheca acuminata' phytoplasma]